eukprot:gene14225-19208_t
MLFRYIEVKLAGSSHTVLLPINFARIGSHDVQVHAILAHQFADVPAHRTPDQVTMLEEEKIPYHALDLDPERVAEAQSAGAAVSYGDATRRESLIAAGIHRAAALVVTFADTSAALKTLHFANELAPALPAIVRSVDEDDLDRLRAGGADEVVPETIEGSLMLASHALLLMGVPLRRVV